MLYLDNSSTTAIDPLVIEAMLPYLKEEYGNPSSKYYTLATNAKKAVEKAREQVANLLGCESDEVIFTSGATESNNMILKGVSDYYSDSIKKSIITSLAEHPSILESCKYLESKGNDVIYNDVDRFGRVSVEKIKSKINDDTLLVSIIWGNNEVGSLNPIKEISEICFENNVFFHTDATQVIGKINVDLKSMKGINFLSFSAHKINGPKGIGASFIRKENPTIYTKITPLLHGGGQENNYRSGTLAVHNIVGLGMASYLAKKRIDENITKLNELEDYLVTILKNKLGDKLVMNSDQTNKIPGVLSVQFVGVNNELLIKKLSSQIALSTGSACSSSEPSHVLRAMGLSLDEIRQTVRITLSPSINKKDLDIFKTL